MKKTPAELLHEATRLTLEGDAAGATARLHEALSLQQPKQSEMAEPAETARESGTPAATFTDGVFTHQGMDMNYKLFVPTLDSQEPAPLLLMLHGCSQTADGFATSTRMNAVAQAAGMIVLYPAQSTSANPNKCWNWFEPIHQIRGSGEPDVLSALTLHVLETLPVDPQQVFVAGFSAGAAMALVLAEQYPELYSAVGVHSGLPTGVASSNREAFAMMMGSPADNTNASKPADSSITVSPTPHADIHTSLIVFHGSQDRVVNVVNAERIIANWLSREMTRTAPVNWMPLTLTHNTATGHHYIVTTYVAEEQPERTGCEYWQLSEGGHGWSGGSANGSYTEQKGPDASAEMVRFFLESISARR